MFRLRSRNIPQMVPFWRSLSDDKIEVRSDELPSAAYHTQDLSIALVSDYCRNMHWRSAARSAASDLTTGWHLAVATAHGKVLILHMLEVQGQLILQCIMQHHAAPWNDFNFGSLDGGVLAFWTPCEDWEQRSPHLPYSVGHGHHCSRRNCCAFSIRALEQ